MKTNKLSKNDIVGVIAPSRPIYTRKAEFERGLDILREVGFKIKLSKNIYSHDFYSAGTPEQRAQDINEMFCNNKVKAIICATGGITSNQTLGLIDYNNIKNNPKMLIGYSDNSNLLLAIHEKTGLTTFYGPDICELGNQNKETIKKYEDFLKTGVCNFDCCFEVIKTGKGKGSLKGGNLFTICGLLSSKYSPDFENSILFWEDAGLSPAKLDFHLNQLKLSGALERLSAMIVGHLDDCVDNKYPQDNKPVEEILLDLCVNYEFPIIKTEKFGHEIKNFEILPIGSNCNIDTEENIFDIS